MPSSNVSKISNHASAFRSSCGREGRSVCPAVSLYHRGLELHVLRPLCPETVSEKQVAAFLVYFWDHLFVSITSKECAQYTRPRRSAWYLRRPRLHLVSVPAPALQFN